MLLRWNVSPSRTTHNISKSKLTALYRASLIEKRTYLRRRVQHVLGMTPIGVQERTYVNSKHAMLKAATGAMMDYISAFC